MKHTIKTMHGRAVVLELAESKGFAWLELVGPDRDGVARAASELMEVEHLQSLVIAAEAMIERIRALQEGNKRMSYAQKFANKSAQHADEVRAAGWPVIESGARCHDANACQAGQTPCPSKAACGVSA